MSGVADQRRYGTSKPWARGPPNPAIVTARQCGGEASGRTGSSAAHGKLCRAPELDSSEQNWMAKSGAAGQWGWQQGLGHAWVPDQASAQVEVTDHYGMADSSCSSSPSLWLWLEAKFLGF